MGNWVNEKPKFKKECILLVATLIRGEWDYSAFWIKKEEDGDGFWYWGCFAIEGEEWGDINDLTADLYKTVNIPAKKQ